MYIYIIYIYMFIYYIYIIYSHNQYHPGGLEEMKLNPLVLVLPAKTHGQKIPRDGRKILAHCLTLEKHMKACLARPPLPRTLFCASAHQRTPVCSSPAAWDSRRVRGSRKSCQESVTKIKMDRLCQLPPESPRTWSLGPGWTRWILNIWDGTQSL